MHITKTYTSADGISIKYAQQTDDNHMIETTYVNRSEKHIVCYSTQIGCTCGCRFCYSGLQDKFVRNLTITEIVDQCINVIEFIEKPITKPILFSAMGIGEPMNNYFNWMSAMTKLAELYPGCRFAVATNTSMPSLLHGLCSDSREKLLDLKITFSLHSAIPEIRKMLMPKSATVDSLMYTAWYYWRLSGKRPEFNISLIDGVNDSDNDARAIIKELTRFRLLDAADVKINRFNHVIGCDYAPSSKVNEFINILKAGDVNVEYYETNASDVNGACGQMAAH